MANASLYYWIVRPIVAGVLVFAALRLLQHFTGRRPSPLIGGLVAAVCALLVMELIHA